MPQSISSDMGKTWTYSASPFPEIGGGQRLALLRLKEGPIILISFTDSSKKRKNRSWDAAEGMSLYTRDGKKEKAYRNVCCSILSMKVKPGRSES